LKRLNLTFGNVFLCPPVPLLPTPSRDTLLVPSVECNGDVFPEKSLTLCGCRWKPVSLSRCSGLAHEGNLSAATHVLSGWMKQTRNRLSFATACKSSCRQFGVKRHVFSCLFFSQKSCFKIAGLFILCSVQLAQLRLCQIGALLQVTRRTYVVLDKS